MRSVRKDVHVGGVAAQPPEDALKGGQPELRALQQKVLPAQVPDRAHDAVPRAGVVLPVPRVQRRAQHPRKHHAALHRRARQRAGGAPLARHLQRVRRHVRQQPVARAPCPQVPPARRRQERRQGREQGRRYQLSRFFH